MIRFGVLGAARIVPPALTAPARRVPGVEVVALAARDRERAEAFGAKHRIPRVVGTYEELVADPGVDAVYIPLPNGLHGRWTLAALAAGKHVLCEKPFTADAAEARSVAGAATTSGLVVAEAFHYRYHPLAARLAEIVRSGELGPIRNIEIAFSAPLARRGDIRYSLELAGGALMDMGCYTVSLLRLLAGGQPTVVSARAKLSSPGVDRAMRARFTLPGGGTASIHCSMFSSSVLAAHAEVVGEAGELRVLNPFSPQHFHRLRVRTDASGRRVERLTRRPTYDFQLQAFAEAIAGGASVLTPPEDAVRNMALIDDIYRAAHLERANPRPEVDADQVAQVRQAGLEAAERLGASHAEVRVERVRSQIAALRDATLETAADDTVVGLGVRVVHDGAIGFAATVAVDPQAAADLADQAVAAARVTTLAGGRRVELAPEPVHSGVDWVAPHRIDPVSVPLADKVARLAEWSRRLLDAPGVDHVTAHVLAVTEEKHYADLAGTTATQQRVRIHPALSALALTPDGGFEEMRTVAPPAGRGWEYLEGEGWDWDAELSQLPELLSAKLASPSVEAGRYDLVIDPTNLWLTIHESVGHATELDRALGYEAAYAGTSFATPDKLGTLEYGSPLMNVTGDRTAEFGLATVAIDDEGVEGQSFDLVRDGILVGYQLDRGMAAVSGAERSNGCAFADSPLHVPIQRMANVSLSPAAGGPTTADLISGVERGIYIVGDKSWSIDMQRYNFQFTGQRFFRIVDGRLAGQVRDVAYQANTTEFWGSLTGLGGRSTYLLAGAFNCGKGQPGQVAAVSHGCPSALFEQVRVLNTREESGR